MGFDYKKKVLEFYSKHLTHIKYLRDFIVMTLLYGCLLALTMAIFLPSYFKFNIGFVVAFGLARYFIMEELPRAIRKAFK